MEIEIWKKSITLPEYEVSSIGRIRRISYEAPMPYGGTRTYGGQAWYGATDPKQYGRKVFQYKGKTYRVARLICEAFHGSSPFPKAVVMHKDDDAGNNNYDNLKWGTQKENLNTPKFIEHCRNRKMKKDV